MCGDGHDFTSCQLFCGPWREEGVVSVCMWGPATCQIGWLDQFCSFHLFSLCQFQFPFPQGKSQKCFSAESKLGSDYGVPEKGNQEMTLTRYEEKMDLVVRSRSGGHGFYFQELFLQWHNSFPLRILVRLAETVGVGKKRAQNKNVNPPKQREKASIHWELSPQDIEGAGMCSAGDKDKYQKTVMGASSTCCYHVAHHPPNSVT